MSRAAGLAVALRARAPGYAFAWRAGLALTAVLAAGAHLADRFRLGLDDQASRCLPPYRLFLIDRHDRAISQGDLVAFRALGERMGPWFRDGATVIKRAAAVSGDHVQVTQGPAPAVRVNGVRVGEGLALAGTPALAQKLGVPVLLKGGHAAGTDTLTDVLATPAGDTRVFTAARHPHIDTHGSGCTLAAAIAAHIARGRPLAEAVAAAHAYLRHAIAAPVPVAGREYIAHLR